MKKLFILFFILLSSNIYAFDPFTVSDIRIVGLQRVSTGSIFNVIPISVGDEINQRKSVDITKSLFLTDQFDDRTLYLLEQTHLSTTVFLVETFASVLDILLPFS